jgi:hypothetical protein
MVSIFNNFGIIVGILGLGSMFAESLITFPV